MGSRSKTQRRGIMFKINSKNFVEFPGRNFSYRGDRGTWVRAEADGSYTLFIGAGTVSAAYIAELNTFLAQFGKEFADFSCGVRHTLTPQMEAPEAAEEAEAVAEETPAQEVKVAPKATLSTFTPSRDREGRWLKLSAGAGTFLARYAGWSFGHPVATVSMETFKALMVNGWDQYAHDAHGTAIRIELHGWREEDELVPANAE